MGLKIAYILLTLVTLYLLAYIGIKSMEAPTKNISLLKKKKRFLIGGLILWQVYVYLIANSGILDNFDFPPRFFIFLVLPLFIFTGVFIYTNRNKTWIQKIPSHWLIFFQSFRVFIEAIFVFSVAQGILNKEVTIEGYNYDMIFAFTAPVIGYLMYKKLISRKIVILWNYLGLIVIGSIIFLFLSSVFNPHLFGRDIMLLPEEAVKYPYVLVAGFLMPAAVFIHVLSIVQLSNKNIL